MQCVIRSQIPQLTIRFRDYLRGKYHIELRLREERLSSGETEFCGDFDETSPQFTLVAEEANLFIQNPLAERYQQASWENGDTRTLRYVKVKEQPDPHHYWSRWNNIKFTIFITALCAIIFLLEELGYDQQIMAYAHYPIYWGDETEYWRYFSHAFVHLSPLHILFNLSWWWIFGGAIERHFGSLKLIGLFLIAALISGITQNWASGPLFFGLSGVVYAVMGFVFALDKFGATQGTVLPKGFFTMLIVGIALGFASPLIGIKMGNAAHISGLIVGLILGFLQAKVR